MSDKSRKQKHPGRRGLNLSAAPMTTDELVRGIFQISPDDVKRIVKTRPGKTRPGKKKS